MTPVFLDTVGLLAIWDEADKWHALAEETYSELLRARRRLVTTSFVFLECGNAAARRPYRRSVDVLRRKFELARVIVVPSDEDYATAWSAYGDGHAGGAGIVDQVSFVVMRRLGVTAAFTNDRHFRAAGFEILF